MAKIDVWLEYGRSIFGFIQKLREPQFVIILKDEKGDLTPIYEGCNEAEPGIYKVLLYMPFETEKVQDNGVPLQISPSDKEVHIAVWFLDGTLRPSRRDDWQAYASKKQDRLKRYIGWDAASALKMLSD